jgi:hypothetical protein
VSPVAHKPSLQRMGIETERLVKVGVFMTGQRQFLEFHRNAVLLQASGERKEAHKDNGADDEPSMHVPDEALEQYALGRMSEPEEAPVEEHLLVCQRCRDEVELIDRIRSALWGAVQ